MLSPCRQGDGRVRRHTRAVTSISTVAAARGGERGSRRGNARGIGSLERPGARPRSQVRLLGPLTISRRRASRWRCRRRARCARSSPIWRWPRMPSRAASSASCCGTSPTIRAASCAGASARSGASSTSPVGAGSRPRADTIRLDLADCFVDAIEIARATQEGIETLAAERLRSAVRAVRRRLPRRAGDRPQPASSTAG